MKNCNSMPKLETGMYIITSNGSVGVVINDYVLYNKHDTELLQTLMDYVNEYNDYIRYIIMPESPYSFYGIQSELFVYEDRIVYDGDYIWKYEPPARKVTIKEIEEKFGCKVEIING